MLFFIFVGLVVLGFIFLIRNDMDDHLLVPGIFCTIVGGIGVITSICIIGANHIGVEGQVAAMDTRYEHLVYQYDNNIYDNDNDLGKRELMVDIQNWNEDLAWYQANQDDLYIGIYIPNIYDQFELIELSVG